jgi:hypothetical protein
VPTTSAQPRRLRREPNSRSGARSDIMSDTDSYFGWTDGGDDDDDDDNARPRFGVALSSLSDVDDDDPTSESCS